MDMDPKQFELARSIANYLDDYQPLAKRCCGVHCVLEHHSQDGREIWINTQNPKKLDIHTSWIHHKGSLYKPDSDSGLTFSIGVGVGRSPEAVAKEITRRLLPGYDEHYAEQLKKKNDYIARANAELALRDEVRNFLGDDPIAEHLKDARQVPCYRHGVNKIYVSGDTVRIDTDYLPADVAMAVCALLKEKMPHRRV